MRHIFPQISWCGLSLVLAVLCIAPTTLAFTQAPCSGKTINAALLPQRSGRTISIVYSSTQARPETTTRSSTKLEESLKQPKRLGTTRQTSHQTRIYHRPRSIALAPLDDDSDEVLAHEKEEAVVEASVATRPVDVAPQNALLDMAATREGKVVDIRSTSVDHHSTRTVVDEKLMVLVDPVEQAPVSNGYTVSNAGNPSRPVSLSTTTAPFFSEKDGQSKMNQQKLESTPSELNLVGKEEDFESEIAGHVASTQEDLVKALDFNDAAANGKVPAAASAKEAVAPSVVLQKEDDDEKGSMLYAPVLPDVEPPSALLPKKEREANVVCAQAFAAVDHHPILLFDGACNLCNDWVNFCLDYDVQASFRFASLQSKVGKSILIRDGRSPDDYSDIILATPQDTYARTDAVLRVVSQLEGLPILLRVAATFARIFFPPWFRDAAYKFIAANRHIFGDTDGPVCRLDLDGEYFGRFIEDPELEDSHESLPSESKEKVYAPLR